ncbi:ABC transporter ATP-binding protein [Bosea sp. 2KB_26]
MTLPSPREDDGSLLQVRDLHIAVGPRSAPNDVVHGVSFNLGRERLAIVGESGSGKTMTARAIIGLLPPAAHARHGVVQLKDSSQNLLALPEKALRRIRGARISMVLQDPKYCLDPMMTVGRQIEEGLRSASPSKRDRALELLEAVKIRDPQNVYDLYPHQLSGGMGQRVMIAAMLAPEPEILIADEPTSALDVTVRSQILRILDDLVEQRGLGLLFISHDLDLVSTFCDRVLVMLKGRLVEEIEARRLSEARHPYTRALLAARPSLSDRRSRLTTFDRSTLFT